MSEKVKKPFYKKWWFWLIIIVLVIGIAGTGGEDQTEPEAVANEDSEEAADDASESDNSTDEGEEGTEADEEELTEDEFSVGEAVQLGDNVLTVTEVEKSDGDEFDQPKSGNEYVIVHVEIENSGEENISYNPFNFKMANSEGQIVDQALTIIDSDTALESGELAPGGTVSGTIVFEQPADDPELQLQFEPSFWSGDMIKINLQ
ncbi:DUF4352 domain-containing protein [Virgibacillus sp. YIM 98842]|jgi:hypothetical protein|uniref:DUF4352 domain-containing protein n=1 Tax=Virgibacillus sp. YIM 98842 TaxID=2663533 RepID=UPI0013DA8C14|nr:DUF4352 domain-containing protein [Virgibacillus sp. YIM 98842]